MKVTEANGDNIPANATAAVISVTAAGATSPTSLTVYPTGSTPPAAATMYVAGSGQAVDNQTTIAIGLGGQITIANTAGTIDVLVDVVGYYSPATNGSGFQAVTPTRICDTRLSAPANQCNSNGTAAGTLTPGSTATVQVTGNAGVPAGVTAAVVDLGAFSADPGGTFTAYPDGTPQPATTTLSYPAAGAGPAVTSWASNREDLFVRGADNAIWHRYWISGTGWSAWESLGTTIVSNPAAISRGVNEIDLFGTGTSGSIYEKSWNGSTWTAWTLIGAPSVGIAPGSGPAITSWASNREDLFVRGADNAIWHRYWISGTGWSAWESLGTTIVSNPAAISRGVNEIDLFGTGTNGSIYEKSWNGSAWTAWGAVGAPTPGTQAGQGPAVSSSGSSRDDLFVRGADNAIWHEDWISGTGWSAWDSLGPTIVSNPAAISPTGTTTIDLYGTGSDDNSYRKTWNGSSWTAWGSTGAPTVGIAPDSNGPGVNKETVVPLGSDGRFDLHNATGTTDLTVDVEGYYTPNSGNQYYPLAPITVASTGIGANSTATVPVINTNSDRVPANATAVVVNLTDTTAAANSTFTAYPAGSAQPSTTTLTFQPGEQASNEATVGIGTNGAIQIGNGPASATLTVTVEGYFTTTGTNPVASYTYNGDGLEAAAQPNTAPTPEQLTWDTTHTTPLLLSDGAQDYIYSPSGTPAEQINLASSTPTYLTYTPSDNTWLTTNQAGGETGYWGYDAYGTPVYGTLVYGTPTTPFGYAGQYQDATTGLVNDTARWYQTQTGGFTTRDPAFAITDTAYTYANGDPVNNSDPLGLCGGLGWFTGDCEARAVASGATSAWTDTTDALTNPAAWQAEASFWAGAGNFGLSSLQSLYNLYDPLAPLEEQWLGIPQLQIANPYCNDSGFYSGGEVFAAGAATILSFGATPEAELGVGAAEELGVGAEAGASDVLATPEVENTKLQNIVIDLYKGTTNPNRVGTGTTADAVRNELATGEPTGGTFHLQKATQYSTALGNLIKSGNLNPYDQLVAQSLLDDLQSALRSTP